MNQKGHKYSVFLKIFLLMLASSAGPCLVLGLYELIRFHKVIYGKENPLMIVVGISIMLSIIVAGLIAQDIIAPIKLLLNAIRSYRLNKSQPDFSPFQRHDEFGFLFDEYEKMMREVSVYQTEVAKNASLAAIGQMSSHIAHDMRSPLSVLKCYVENDDSSSDQDALDCKKAARRSVGKLLRMAEELVDYSKAAKVERNTIELSRFLNESVAIKQRDTVPGSKVIVDCNDCDNIYVTIDVDKMGRVLMNLVHNAIQATAHNQGNIEIKASLVGNHDLLITVSDEGKGIEPQYLTHIFDVFFTTGKKGGTGLGLSYCRQVVEAHGGAIYVQSEVDKGTAFTVHVPNCVVKKQINLMIQGADLLRYTGKRFLLVDDDDDVRRNWRAIIEDSGGHVMCEMDSAHKTINNEKDIHYESIDTAIVDYKFPDSNVTGIDVVKYLKSKGVKEIYLCTGYADDPDIKKSAISAGAISVIGKSTVAL